MTDSRSFWVSESLQQMIPTDCTWIIVILISTKKQAKGLCNDLECINSCVVILVFL